MAIRSIDSETTQQYGLIKATLKKKGRPIPENDIWIASLTVQYKLKLVMRNKHFNYIDGLVR